MTVWFREEFGDSFFAVEPLRFTAYGEHTIVHFNGPGHDVFSIRLPGNPEVVAAEFGIDLNTARDVPRDEDDDDEDDDGDDRRGRDD